MLPTAYEFRWDTGHLVFFGIFYSVVTLLICGLAWAFFNMLRDLKARRYDALKWHEDLAGLPANRKRCRHQLSGHVETRLCQNEFDCNTCEFHRAFLALDAQPPTDEAVDCGLDVPIARYFHRGHAWVEPTGENRFKVGIDDLARRCLGQQENLRPPPVGSQIRLGQRIFQARQGHLHAGIAAPLSGTVVSLAEPDQDWLLTIEADEQPAMLAHLLTGHEARVWMLRELEQLQTMLRPGQSPAALADGGQPVDDLMAACPQANWDAIWGKLFLES